MSNRLVKNNCDDGFGGFSDQTTVYQNINSGSQSRLDFYVNDLSGIGGWDNGGPPCLLYGESALVLNPTAPFPMVVPVNGTRLPALPLQPVGGGTAGVIELSPSPKLNFLARQAVGVGTFKNIVGRHPNTFGALPAVARVIVYRNDPGSLFTIFGTPGLPVKPFFFQNNRWNPYPPYLDRYAPSGVGEGMIVKLGTTIPSGPYNLCRITGVALVTGPGQQAPAIVCHGGSYTLRMFGLNLPATAAFVRLSGGGCPTVDFPVIPPPAVDQGYLLTAPITIPAGTCATMALRLLDASHTPIAACPSFTSAIRIKSASCNPALPQLVLKLIGRNKVAPGFVNEFALYYRNISPTVAANGVTFKVTCIPDGTRVTAQEVPLLSSVVTGPFTATCGCTPLSQQAQKVTRALVNVPPNTDGYIVFSLQALGLTPACFRLQGSFTGGGAPAYTDAMNVNIVASQDPNDKQGLTGIGAPRYITGTEPMPYQVEFENKPTATAPAKVVIVTDKLVPEKVDLSTFRLGPILFGSHVVTPPSGAMSYATDVPYAVNGNPADDIIVRINVSMNTMVDDANFGLVTWTLRSIDPITGQPPVDPLRGFLPPNTTPPKGQGSVFFSVDPLSNLIGGDTIANSARIVFDNNPYIDTPVWVNTIDTTESELTINKQGNSAVVMWTGYGTLQSTANLLGEWDDVPDATSPYVENTAAQKFFRLRQ